MCYLTELHCHECPFLPPNASLIRTTSLKHLRLERHIPDSEVTTRASPCQGCGFMEIWAFAKPSLYSVHNTASCVLPGWAVAVIAVGVIYPNPTFVLALATVHVISIEDRFRSCSRVMHRPTCSFPTPPLCVCR